MKQITAFLMLAVMAFVVLGTSCSKDEDKDENIYVVATINHEGFDFSAGGIPAIWENADGETVSWQPNGGNNPNYPNNENWIWWRNSHLDPLEFKNLTKDMGEVALASVTTVPSGWDESPDILPLIPNHVIVAKCKDGYVKFRVISADPNGLWPAQVEYYFSTSTTFNN